MPERPKRLSEAIERVYAVFGRYPRRTSRAGDVLRVSATTPRRSRRSDRSRFASSTRSGARRFAWESADHWQDTATYKHFLPVNPRGAGAPPRCEDLYPAHLFETLTLEQTNSQLADGGAEAVRELVEAAAERDGSGGGRGMACRRGDPVNKIDGTLC